MFIYFILPSCEINDLLFWQESYFFLNLVILVSIASQVYCNINTCIFHLNFYFSPNLMVLNFWNNNINLVCDIQSKDLLVSRQHSWFFKVSSILFIPSICEQMFFGYIWLCINDQACTSCVHLPLMGCIWWRLLHQPVKGCSSLMEMYPEFRGRYRTMQRDFLNFVFVFSYIHCTYFDFNNILCHQFSWI